MALLNSLLRDYPRADPMFVDYYSVLGVSPKAIDKEIRRAYRTGTGRLMRLKSFNELGLRERN